MKGNFRGISGIFFYLYVGKILPKCGFAACKRHHDARARARTVVFAVGKCLYVKYQWKILAIKLLKRIK